MDTIWTMERNNGFYSYSAIFELEISEHAKLVYICLCRCANEEGQASPSLAEIADMCNVTTPVVIKAIKELEENGLIKTRTNDEGQITYIICAPNQ